MAGPKTLRRPIVTIMGHVDHGKTKILDTIRRSTVAEREAGAITQAIGASIVPLDTIKRITGPLLKALKTDITLPGLLFIDTPGHAAFSNLRRRGGNLADIAILVIDINEGLKPQTIEALGILKKYKTPFVIAANKMDLVSGWRKTDGMLVQQINAQSRETQQLLDTKIYELVGKIYEHGFESERFDRVEDYTKKIVIIPTCATDGTGLAELLMLLTGLAQKFLNQCLECNVDGPGKGTILEVKEEKGLGTTLDVIIYDGKIKVNDTIVIGNIGDPIVVKVRALVEPMPLSEMRDAKSKFKPVKEIIAATGVKISAKDIQDAIAGMPLRVVGSDDLERIKEEIQKEIDEVLIETDRCGGLVIKADSLGSLEAMVTLLREKNIPIMKASVGNITKKDITDAQCNLEHDVLLAVVLGFNVVMTPDALAHHDRTTVFTNQVIYRLIEDFEKWTTEEKKKIELERLGHIIKPFKLEVLRGYVFRQSNPAVFGVEVVLGTAKSGAKLFKSDNSSVSSIKGIQLEQKSADSAEKGKQVAISVDKITVGRQVNEGDILYSDLNEEEFRQLKDIKDLLSPEEKELLKEIADIKRKVNPIWGV